MSKLTLEEAIASLEYLSRNDCYGYRASLRMGAEALRFQERYRWRKLEEEKPTEPGLYLTVCSRPNRAEPYALTWWYGSSGFLDRAVIAWAFIKPYEDE